MDLTLLNNLRVADIAGMSLENIMAAANYTDGDDTLKAQFFTDLDAASDVNPDIKAAIMSKKPMPGGKKSGKGTKKRKENPMLASWRKFVRKVQHEEKITYPEAMKRASKRKSEWKRGGGDDGVINGTGEGGPEGENGVQEGGIASPYVPLKPAPVNHGPKPMIAGSRRRRGSKKRRGTKKRRGSRRR